VNGDLNHKDHKDESSEAGAGSSDKPDSLAKDAEPNGDEKQTTAAVITAAVTTAVVTTAAVTTAAVTTAAVTDSTSEEGGADVKDKDGGDAETTKEDDSVEPPVKLETKETTVDTPSTVKEEATEVKVSVIFSINFLTRNQMTSGAFYTRRFAIAEPQP